MGSLESAVHQALATLSPTQLRQLADAVVVPSPDEAVVHARAWTERIGPSVAGVVFTMIRPASMGSVCAAV